METVDVGFRFFNFVSIFKWVKTPDHSVIFTRFFIYKTHFQTPEVSRVEILNNTNKKSDLTYSP